MEAYAEALTYAIPGFVVLIIIEAIAARMMGIPVNRGMDVIASLSSGMTNTLKSVLGLGVALVTYKWMEERIGLFDIQSTPLLYVLAFIGHDFAGYWSHRINHSINVCWNRHVVHHSSEEFNLSCALRQEMSAFVGIYFFLYIPTALLGVPWEIFAVVGPLHLFAQFWYHTRLIGKLGFLEHILVTPSHHRVHHAINDIYLDKNLSQIFIIWDKLFGTFQEELEEEPCVYGTLTPANTWNPVIINFAHVWRLFLDALHTRRWVDKLRLWFMPLGWRPDDVIEQYPRPRLGVHERSKYDPFAPPLLKAWSWFQFVLCNLMLYHLLASYSGLDRTQIVWYAVFLFVTIFSYTTLMDRSLLAIPVEVVRLVLGLLIINSSGGWLGVEEYSQSAGAVMAGYLAVSMLATVYYSVTARQRLAAA